jgi:hypothetical protein
MATVVSTAGKGVIAGRIKGNGTEPVYVGSGTGAGTAAAGDTTLFTEVSEARVSGTSSIVTSTTYRVVGTQTYTGSKTVTNAGNFDASTNGNLLVHGDFAGIAVAANDSIEFTIDCTIG